MIAIVIIVFLIFLSPYIIIPWIFSFFFKKNKVQPVFLTYVFTAILTIAYTIFLQLLPMMHTTKEGNHNCVPPIIIIIVPLLPISLFMQFVFNKKRWLLAFSHNTATISFEDLPTSFLFDATSHSLLQFQSIFWLRCL